MSTQATQELILDKEAIRKVRLMYRSVNHELRRQILQLIHKKEEIKVTDIYTSLKRVQSETSQHLAVLRRAGLVKARRDGKQIFYSINYNRLREFEAKAVQLNQLD
jgi:DNA-binding transcriptional ArsR family regulator